MGNICFVASSHDFLFRHFSTAVKAAQAERHHVFAFVPSKESRSPRNSDSVNIIWAPFFRAANSPISIVREAFWLTSELRTVKPSLVVAYSLRMCLIACLARLFLTSSGLVLVITGTGFIGLRRSFASRLLGSVVFRIIRTIAGRRSYFIFENSVDPARFGLSSRRNDQVSIFMGAGVEIDEFSMVDIPPSPPFRFCTVSRLVWSKGIDIAAKAISSLALEGYPVELHIYGSPDMANPRPMAPESLRGLPGVEYHGFTDEVADVWKRNHAAIFTSRGGEGLPRALLEAASCGRACVVTAVPGCSDFIRDGVEGYVVPLDRESELRAAILKLISDRTNLATLGARARQRVMETSTTAIVQAKYERIFRLLLEQSEDVPREQQASETSGPSALRPRGHPE